MKLTEKQINIFTGAVELIYENGYKETSVRDLAAKINMNPAALYLEFKSKEEILVWICDDIYDRFSRILIEVNSLDDTAEKKCYLLVKRHIEEVLSNTKQFIIGSDYMHIADQLTNNKYSIFVNQYVEVMKKIIYQIIPNNQFAEYLHKDTSIFVLLYILNHTPKWAVLENGKYDIDCMTNHILSKFLNGLF